MGVFNLIAALGAAVLISLGGGGVWWFDRHADVDFTMPPPARWLLPAAWKHVHLVGGVLEARAERDKAAADRTTAASELGRCLGTTAAVEAALDRQNAAVAAVQRAGEAKAAKSAKAAQAARAVAESERQWAKAVLELRPAGPDLCAAAEALFRRESE